MRLHEFEMLDHGMAGKSAKLSDDAQHHGPRLCPLELDLALSQISFNPVELAEKIVVPERASELSVGNRL